MATRLKNIVRFQNVAPGASVTLPHDLNWDGRPVLPDEFRRTNLEFTRTGVTDVDVTYRNDGLAPADCDVLCESWHTFERCFGAAGLVALVPQPFESAIAGIGGGGGPVTLQQAYDNGPAGVEQVIELGAGGRLGVVIQDAVGGLGPNDPLFAVRSEVAVGGDDLLAVFYDNGVSVNVVIGADATLGETLSLIFENTQSGQSNITGTKPPNPGDFTDQIRVSAGEGADGDAGTPGAQGGFLGLRSGVGGAGSAAQVSGEGGWVQIVAGDAGADGGAGGNTGGSVQVLGGSGDDGGFIDIAAGAGLNGVSGGISLLNPASNSAADALDIMIIQGGNVGAGAPGDVVVNLLQNSANEHGLFVVDGSANVTNTLDDLVRLQKSTAGVATAGFGLATLYELDAVDAAREAVLFTTLNTDATLRWWLRRDGALAATSTDPNLALNATTGASVFMTDAVTNTQSDALTLDHRTTGVAAVNYGTTILFRGQDNAATAGGDDCIRWGGKFTAVTAGSEFTMATLWSRSNGGALTEHLNIGLQSAASQGIEMRAISANAIEIIGNRAAASGTDVIVRSNNAKTAGFLFAVQRQTTSAFSVRFAGQVVMQRAAVNAVNAQSAMLDFSTDASITLTTADTEGKLLNWGNTATYTFTTTAAGFATQRFWHWQAGTLAFTVGATLTNLFSSVHESWNVGTNVTVTNYRNLVVSLANYTAGPTSATMTIADLAVPAHTVTVSGATAVASACGYAAVRIDQVTVTGAGAAVFTAMASLYIANAPDPDNAVTATDVYSIFVDAGIVRLDGDGAFVLEVPDDATIGVGAHVARVPVRRTGVGGTFYMRLFPD